MQSPAQSNSGPNPVTTATTEKPLDTETEAQPAAQSEPDAQKEGNKSVAPAETKTPITLQENGTEAETPVSMAITQAAENEPTVFPLSEPSENSGGMEVDSTSKPSAPIQPVIQPDTDPGPGCDGQKAKKQDKGGRDGRKYVPSKRAMIDPLKIDMSKPLVMPLTSSQLSLQCIECHIIFSDHKSKERHLKLSHPAEYEQSILRNALFACYVCDRHFTNSSELMAHQKAHTEKKPFKCPICSQAFNKSSELTLHKKIHFGLDGYACTDCGKPCKTMTLLKYHRRTHTGERPYVCKECGKRFTMSKALQKHLVSHLPEGAEGDGGDTTVKAQLKKDDGGMKYLCSVCKASFKSTKTRLHHMKTKHNVLPAAASNALLAGQHVKQSTPIITPISICQPGLLQVEPNGPLQKVDANIDTEQIRKLIESLGNVQKVNQVVILGQVPPHAPPLEVQQISELAEPVNLNLNPPQIDFMGLKQTESKCEFQPSNNPCDSMEQTIILEPITPDGQLENPTFSELGSQIAEGENIELTLVHTEHTETPEGQVVHQIIQQSDITEIQSNHLDQIVCQTEVELKQNLEQTVILELTPALIPTVELEQSQTMQQSEILSSSLVPTTELEKTPNQTPDPTVIEEQETNLSVPPLLHTVELELTPLQREQQDFPPCSFVPPDRLTQTPSESETNPREEVDSHLQTVSLDQVSTVIDEAAPQKTQEKAEQGPFEKEPSNNLLTNEKQGQVQVENLSQENPSAKEEVPSQLETKQVPQISELPVNVMSAQELVKVRKRKPARAFFLQGYMQELAGSIYKNDLQIDVPPAKRQRKKKSHLVVKFGPKSKEKKNKKQKKPSQQRQPQQEDGLRGKTPTSLPEKREPSQKKGRKGKKDKKAGHLISTAEIKLPSLTKDSQMQQIKEDARKKKKKKEMATERGIHVNEPNMVASPVLKKKKQGKVISKDQSTNTKDRTQKKKVARGEKEKAGTASADIPGSHITQDALLLLRGHKQPQLKVYKLDTSKASGQTQEASPLECQTMSQQSRDNKLTLPTSESTNNITSGNKKKGGRPKKNQKALSLLSSLQVIRQPPETLPSKPKTTRKRKASLKIETEGVITSPHSKRALECKDCGERFSEVSSLQKHKAMVHVIESPGLTYTNGNIFEGVSRLDLYQLPRQQDKVVGVMNPATDWDCEPETGEMALEERERSLSFPALIPSPSLPAPLSEAEMSTYEDKDVSKTGADDQSHSSLGVHSTSEQTKNSETPQNFTPESPLNTTAKTSLETGEPSTSDKDKQEEDALKKPSSGSEMQGNTDEDIKEDLLLEVDLVTVGEHSEGDVDPTSHEGTVPQNELNKTCNSVGGHIVQVGSGTTVKSLTSQTVSCSTHTVEVKEEEEELLLQRKKGGKETIARNATRGRRRGMGRPKGDVISNKASAGETVRGQESEKEQEECQIVYEKQPVTSDSEINNKDKTNTRTSEPGTSPVFEANKATVPATSLPSMPSTLEESPEEQVVFELESVTTSVERVINERGLQEGEEHNRDQSPGIILEKFLTSRQRANADKELCLLAAKNKQTQGVDSIDENEVQVLGNQEIKVEENNFDPPQVAETCQNRQCATVQPQHHRDIRTVLVKEETSLVLNEVLPMQGGRHIQWNVEQVNTENPLSPVMESEDTTTDCHVTPEFNTNQCIFYPVKEEEREVLLGAAQTSSGNSTTGTFNDALQTEPQATGSNIDQGPPHPTPDYQEMRMRGLLSEPGISDFADGQGEPDAEWQHPPDLRDFLLQSSDEEDVGVIELSNPQLDSEAEVMAYFNRNQTNSAQQPKEMSQNLSTSVNQPQTPREENRMKRPIDYFSKYFGWDTWVEIARCTNKLSNIPNPVTAREVAQFVGIHIAMGTLKFPSPKLYWEDLTKVPLIAEAMPLPRFLKLTRMLKLASPTKDTVNSNVLEGRRDSNFQKAQQGKNFTSKQSGASQYIDGQRQGDTPNNLHSSKTQIDPLWKVQPLLFRFKEACQSLSRDGDYAVDQYPLPLTGKLHNQKLSLYCTTLIGFSGLLLHVDLKLGLSGKEDAVEQMVPKGSMVFLCKQELSTPAMLERLLVAGVHGAGKVGGARGQIGDEFVSSDGKLMLRRSHCGFILSTAGNSQGNMVSLIDNFEKAQMSAHLNRDLLSLYPIPLTASAPTCWPQAVLWYLTDVALVNSWLLYRQDQRAASVPLTFMAFRLEVSKALILSSGSDTQDSVPSQPPMEKAHATNETPNPSLVDESPLPDAATRYDGSGHWPEQLGEGEGGRCRFGDCQRTSRVLCLKCCVFLCISRNHNCFLNFHNQGSLGKE